MFTPTSFDAPAMDTRNGSSSADSYRVGLMRDSINETIGLGEMPISFPETSTDLEQQLLWPDSEDLLQVIMSDVSAWPISAPTLPPSQNSYEAPEGIAAPFGAAMSSERPVEGGHQAVQYLSQLITTLVRAHVLLLVSNSQLCSTDFECDSRSGIDGHHFCLPG